MNLLPQHFHGSPMGIHFGCLYLLLHYFKQWDGLLNLYGFLGAFQKLRQATISFVMSNCLSFRPSICPSARKSVRMKQWTVLYEIYISTLRKSVL